MRWRQRPYPIAQCGLICFPNFKKDGRNGQLSIRVARRPHFSDRSIRGFKYTSLRGGEHASFKEKEANISPSNEVEQNKYNDDVVSIFGGNDFDADNDDLLQAIDESLRPSDCYGPQVNDTVAKIVNEKFLWDIGLEKRKETIEKYKTPEYCAQLSVPKINEPIWTSLKNFHRQRDLRNAVLQDSIVRVSSALSLTIDELLTWEENKAFSCLIIVP